MFNTFNNIITKVMCIHIIFVIYEALQLQASSTSSFLEFNQSLRILKNICLWGIHHGKLFKLRGIYGPQL